MRERLPLRRFFLAPILAVPVLVLVLVLVAPAARAQSLEALTRQLPSMEWTLMASALEDSTADARLMRSTSPQRRQRIAELRRSFYRDQDFRPAWFSGQRPVSLARDLLRLLSRADELGLRPETYSVTDLQRRLAVAEREERKSADERIGLDVALSTVFFAFILDELEGRIDPAAVGMEAAQPPSVDAVLLLQRCFRAGSLDPLRQQLAAPDQRTRKLRHMLSHYRELARHGGWPAVPAGDDLAVGESLPVDRAQALVARLLAEGDLYAEEVGALDVEWEMQLATSEDRQVIFPELLEQAIQRFQARHGLEQDGKLGPRTLAQLNRPVIERIQQIEINLERLRLSRRSSTDGGERDSERGARIVVNIPHYELVAYGPLGRPALEMAVVVGRESWPTPVFRSEMTHLELNPPWNVPASIAAKEILPKVQKDPSYLEKNGFEVLASWDEGAPAVDPATVPWGELTAKTLPYRFRQRPGPGNSLGKIKFLIPNQYDVYLHDTPAQRDFSIACRSLSHGCVRLSKPLDLAELVMAGSETWDRERLEKALEGKQTTRVPLPRPIPVILYYQTAFLDLTGAPHFLPDIYGRDRIIAAALAELGQLATSAP
ncbi:MAG: L,D-transpeptidase family protein [Acidobacteriota bacterium]|nr:L,D-transpeptidase family protein [Acidobacteriota bacterium]